MRYLKIMMMALMTCFINVSYSQIQTTSTKILAEGNLKGMAFSQYWSITESINNNDTITFFTMGYQNAKYQYISDFGGIVFTNKESMLKFCDEVESLVNMNLEKGSTLQIESDGYKLTRSDSMYIVLYDRDDKYTLISLNKINNGFKKIRESAIYLK